MDLVIKHDLVHTPYLPDAFWDDLTIMFNTECKSALKRGGTVNEAVQKMKKLWDHLGVLTGNKCFHDKAWGYFYATRVVPLKKQESKFKVHGQEVGFFKRILKAMFLDEPWEKRSALPPKDEVRVKLKEKIRENFEKKTERKTYISRVKNDIPQEVLSAVEVLGLTLGKLTAEYIRKQFLKKVKVTHPDKGGNRIMFEAVNEARIILIEWINRRDK